MCGELGGNIVPHLRASTEDSRHGSVDRPVGEGRKIQGIAVRLMGAQHYIRGDTPIYLTHACENQQYYDVLDYSEGRKDSGHNMFANIRYDRLRTWSQQLALRRRPSSRRH